MTPCCRRWRWAGLILAAILVTAGCNPLTSLYFLMPTGDDGVPPECKLTSDDKEKEVHIVILPSCALETRPEFLRVDRELAGLLVQKLMAGFKDKKQKIAFLPLSKVEKFKDEHPNWRALSPAEIGEHFHADYVIDLSIESLSLYEPDSHKMFYRGNTSITVNVIDVHNADEGPIFQKPYTCEYPAKGPVPVDYANNNPQQFRMQFLTRVATELSWLFVSHPYEDHHFQMD